MKGARLSDGRERVVRHGHAPERLVQTGIGPVALRRVKLRDRGAGGGAEGRGFDQMTLLWVLNLADGRHTLLDMAERAAADAAIAAGLLVPAVT